MRDYNEELALLYLLDQELQQKEAVVSFNGKPSICLCSKPGLPWLAWDCRAPLA